MKIKVKEFLEKWKGDVTVEDKTGLVYCSFRENVTKELENKYILNIKLEKREFDNFGGNIVIIVE